MRSFAVIGRRGKDGAPCVEARDEGGGRREGDEGELRERSEEILQGLVQWRSLTFPGF